MRIGEVPMKCLQCGHQCQLDDADIDDPFGDGSIGCPMPDCGGLYELIATQRCSTGESMKHKGLWTKRLPDNPLEAAFAKAWERTAPNTLGHLIGDTYSQRDAEVAATVIQWLGSPVGQYFRRGIRTP